MDSDTRGEQFSMVDQEPATYRPRRAYIEPDAEPAQPERPAQPDRNGTATESRMLTCATDEGLTETEQPLTETEQPLTATE